MDQNVANASHAVDFESYTANLTPGTLGNREAVLEPKIMLELLKRLDSDIACSSEKLLNLDLWITDISLGEKDMRFSSMDNGSISHEQTNNALVLDLSFNYLSSEVIELGKFLNSLQEVVIDAYEKLSLFGNEGELAILFEEKLRSSEGSLKSLQEKFLGLKKQLGTLQRIRSISGQKKSHMFAEENYGGLELKTADQLKLVLRVLDNSISKEMDLEDEPKIKLLGAEQDVSWERLLEAENTAEVFKGVAREMISHLQNHLQILQFDLNDSLQQESELKYKLQAFLEQQEVNKGKNGVHLFEVNAFKERVRILEENLKDSESMLRQANTSKEKSDCRLFQMENIIHSIRESAFTTERRAKTAEVKVVELTEVNMELTEELEFLKGSDNNSQKISMLEKQVRDLEKELEHSKAMSEASQKQQDMLYAAIWDMETLIEDLKSKVFKAETRSERAEDQCLVLAETNSELNKQISCLQSRAESLEASLKEVNRAKGAMAKDINDGTKVVANMVLQLALERERIQKQICSLERENKILMAELRRTRKNYSESTNGKEVDNAKDAFSIMNGIPTSSNGSVGVLQQTSCTSNEVNVNDLLGSTTSNEGEESSLTSPENAMDNPSGPETLSKQRMGNVSTRFILMAILVPVLSVGAMLVICKQNLTALRHFLGLL